MRRLDLRARLVLAIGVVALVQVALALMVISLTGRQLLRQIDDQLEVVAAAPLDAEADPATEPALERLGDAYQGTLSADGELVTVFASNARRESLPPPHIDVDRAARSVDEPITVEAAQGELEYRLLATEGASSGFVITAIPLKGFERTMNSLKVIVAIAAAAVTLVLVAVTWWVLRLGVAPIKRMTAAADSIATGDLSIRLADVDPSTEAGQLGAALNTMMSQIELSFEERARAEERLREFIADASHELRTPVATIRGYAELYHAGALDDRASLDDAMRRTHDESQRMSRLIADLLDLARLDRNPALSMRPVDLTQLSADAVADANAAHPDRSITGPSHRSPVVVDADDDLLRQVLANLIDNAIVHNPPTASVGITIDTTDTLAVLRVVDDGQGMTAATTERVTERFYRADPSRSRNHGGSGLGLAIVASAVAAHRGNVEIDSEPGRGTAVTLTLPLAAEPS